jgi:hypothetical protein
MIGFQCFPGALAYENAGLQYEGRPLRQQQDGSLLGLDDYLILAAVVVLADQ